MKRYAVVFEESAQADVRESYDWGSRAWASKRLNNGRASYVAQFHNSSQ